MPSPTITRALAPAVLACILALAPTRAARAQQAPAPPTSHDDLELGAKLDVSQPIDAEKLVQLCAARLGEVVVADPQLAGTKIRLGTVEAPLTVGIVRAVLDFNDVVLEEREAGGQSVLFAHERRNLPCRCAPPYPVVDLATEGLARSDEVVTAVLRVKNGAGNDIFATVRGLLVRDVNRIGNILYVRGPEVIVLVDFAANVDYYARIIHLLDAPAPALPARSFPLANGSAREVAAELQALYGTTGVGEKVVVPVSPTAGPRFVADARTNELLVTGSSADLATVERLVADLDGKASARAERADWSGALPGSTLWRIAAACATVAFLGQTLILRRIQRRLAIRKM